MTARDALDIATRGSARCLGRDDELGHLRPGACADLVVWDLHEVALACALSDPVEAWLRCGPARAWTTVVGGRILVDRASPGWPRWRTRCAGTNGSHGVCRRVLRRMAAVGGQADGGRGWAGGALGRRRGHALRSVQSGSVWAHS
ncbi:amidohydrolase family protein [Streptomyces sp. MS1.AVA.1]|uniref:Amidohydrolase family protein n=1 Tax=Streptomyces machairae TaxID=3134109 RepID=A0ABU8UGB3_9ACTN